jgi:MOSC domain
MRIDPSDAHPLSAPLEGRQDARMRSRVVPPEGAAPLAGSVVAALAWILGVDVAAVPLPADGHPEPWTLWRGWLGERGLGLVPVLEPATFAWPGPWLALLPDRAGGRVAAVAFGVPGGLVWQLPGGTATLADAEAGFVVAAADLAAWTAPRRDGSTTGRVEAIGLAPEAEAPMAGVAAAVALAGRGLEGDRYAAGHGTFSNPHALGIHLTLVEAEALEALALPALAARRNLVTRGVDLDALIGRRFRVGDAVCVGRRRCEPCAHLERLTAPGVLRGLVHRGGLRADILEGGAIRVGDAIEPLA